MNPELRRNLWLELSLHRLLAAPLVIALCALLIYAAGKQAALAVLAGTSAAGFVAMVLLWGTQLAGASVVEEARDRTWDAQRMSAIGPWTMTWGKLLGAPAFAWYGGLILLLIFLITGSSLALPVVRTAALMICSAILLHATALNASVLAARKGIAYRGTGAMIFLLLALVVISPGMAVLNNADKPVQWWGLTLQYIDLLLASVAAFGAWALLGAYRSMCNELEIRTTPWALPAFILFAATYSAGFAIRGEAGDPQGLFGIMVCGVVFAGTFSYLLLFAEKSGAMTWQCLRVRVQAGLWQRALQELPLWLVALATGLGFVCAATFLSAGTGKGTFLYAAGFAPVAMMLFAVRDAAIFQFFALARQPRRVEAAAVFYLVLLYGIVPGLLSAAGADALAQLVLPPLLKNTAGATIIMLVQAVMAIALAYWRWRKIHAPDSEITPTANSLNRETTP
ncbi:MAG TPA: hypothetical protein VK663_13635 [Burkholderiales bacterium]|nr:hypothetical protein [Burkholderiales bacterium]